MDIYVQIKNKKGEVFKVVNLGRSESIKSSSGIYVKN